jgi:hypothetical protein
MGAAEREAICRTILRELKGRLSVGSSSSVLSFGIHGREATLELPDPLSDESRAIRTRVVVNMKGCSPGILKIYPEGFTTPISKFFGAQDIRIGERTFDALYVVKAKPESLAHSLFREDRKPRVIHAIRAVGAWLNPLIDLSRERLCVQVEECFESLESLRKLVQTAKDLTGFLLDMESLGSILWGVSPEPSGGICNVCGSPMASGVVRCSSCRTPHHRECWDYIGTCSTYACGGKTLE